MQLKRLINVKKKIVPQKLKSKPLVLSIMISGAMQCTFADDVLPIIQTQAVAESDTSYTIQKSNSTTKLNLSLKDTPQSISVFTQQQIKDQNLKSAHDILSQTVGVTVEQYGQLGAGYTDYYSRGFKITNVQRDGIPTNAASFGGSDMMGLEDSALYERLEITRGSTGLTSGSGNPSASINYVRKRPTKELMGSINVQGGSWDNLRSQFDVSGALNQDQSMRGRAVAVFEQGGNQQDRFHRQNAVVYGAFDVDLSDQTTLTSAITLQQVKIDDGTAHGFPFVSNDDPKQPTRFDRDDNAAANWTYSDTEKMNVILGLEHQFNDQWKGVANYAYTHAQNDRVYGVVGSGGVVYDSVLTRPNFTLQPNQMVVTSGRLQNSPEVHALDLYGSGDFNALGRQHSASFGINGYRIQSDDPKYDRYYTPVNIQGWNGQVARPDMPITGRTIVDEKQIGAFASVKLQLLDPLKLILGSRVSSWERDVSGSNQKQDHIFTPYVGLIFDITDQISAYGSYTSIFNPSSNEDQNGNYLDPEQGNSFEFGFKTALFDEKLNASAAYFVMNQDNFAVIDGTDLNINGKQPYKSIDGAEVKGFDVSLAGELMPNWNIQAGYTYTDAKDHQGKDLNTAIPEQTFKLFSTYRWNQWTLGGGVNWQSEFYDSSAVGLATRYNRQDSYVLVNLMGRYDINKDLTLGVNVNNLFDEEYKVNTVNTWGTGRNITASLNYQF